MSRRTPQAETEPIENLIQLIGWKWSTIIKWLVGLIPGAFLAGLGIGVWVTNSKNDIAKNAEELRHQRELYQSIKEAKTEFLSEYKVAAELEQKKNNMIKEILKNEK